MRGLELSRLFFQQIVKEILEKNYPNLKYAAALIGDGSEVLGFDDDISTDHDWGVRLQIFLSHEDYNEKYGELMKLFQRSIPDDFEGYQTKWGGRDKWNEYFSMNGEEITHRIHILDIDHYFTTEIGTTTPKTIDQWLSIPQHVLCKLSSGEVFYDAFGKLTKIRSELEFYPEIVRLIILRGEWGEIEQNMAFPGRTGMVGDDIGSRMLAVEQIRRMIRIVFSLERTYYPYAKWFGTAFKKLKSADRLLPYFEKIMRSDDWVERDKSLVNAYIELTKLHKEYNIIDSYDITPQNYHTRPQIVVDVERLLQDIQARIEDYAEDLPYMSKFGNIDTFVTGTNVIDFPTHRMKLISNFFNKE